MKSSPRSSKKKPAATAPRSLQPESGDGGLSPRRRLNLISEQGLCIGCGLCESLAGSDRVHVEMTANGYERPVIAGDISHALVDQILKVCPGVKVDGLPPGMVDADSREDKLWGPYRRVVRCCASDPEVRYRGATGGVLSALGIYLLDSGAVDFIVHIAAFPRFPTCGIRHISFTREVETEITMRDMDRYQPHQVDRKHVVEARHIGIRRAGQLCPRSARLRLRELALENDWRENLRQARGAKHRIDIGRNKEPTPKSMPPDE